MNRNLMLRMIMVVIAVTLVATAFQSDAKACFGLLRGGNDCCVTTCCEPVCCETTCCEPVCECTPCETTCCEPVCDDCCGRRDRDRCRDRGGRLGGRLFNRGGDCCCVVDCCCN